MTNSDRTTMNIIDVIELTSADLETRIRKLEEDFESLNRSLPYLLKEELKECIHDIIATSGKNLEEINLCEFERILNGG